MIYPPDSGILSSLCLRVETADNSWNCSSFCSRKSICKRVGLECLIGAPVDNHDVFFFIVFYHMDCGASQMVLGYVSLDGDVFLCLVLLNQPNGSKQWVNVSLDMRFLFHPFWGFTMVLPWFYHGISMPPPPSGSSQSFCVMRAWKPCRNISSARGRSSRSLANSPNLSLQRRTHLCQSPRAKVHKEIAGDG